MRCFKREAAVGRGGKKELYKTNYNQSIAFIATLWNYDWWVRWQAFHFDDEFAICEDLKWWQFSVTRSRRPRRRIKSIRVPSLPYPFQTIQIIVGHYTAQQSNGKWMETRADPVQIQTEIDFYNAMRIGQFYSSHSAKMIHIGGWWMVRHWILASNDRL